MVKMIPLHLIDVDTAHAPNFIFRVPRPEHGRYLILLFRTGALIDTRIGREEVSPGDCVIHSPGFPLWHTSLPASAEGFRNDWFYVSPEAFDPALDLVHLPLNTRIPTGRKNLIEPYLRSLRETLIRNDEFSSESIRSILKSMMISVARAHRDFQEFHGRLSGQERSHFERIRSSRIQLLSNPSEIFDIQRLAMDCSLSPERFVCLYKSFFGCTPFVDLMRARNLLAQHLLLQTGKSIAEIASACGWRDHRYFDRVFRKMNAVSPMTFRKNNGA